MKNILVTGSLAFDFIMDFPDSYENHILPDKIKTLSVSFLVDNLNKNFGGIAGNIAYTLALLDQKTTILACAGEKDFAGYKSHLEKVKIDTSSIKIIPDEFSANAFMITDKNNCQIAGFYPGALAHDTSLSLKNAGKIDFVVVAPTVPDAMEKFAKEAKELNIPYLYDPAQQIPRISKEQLMAGIDGAEIVIGNDYELALIQEKTGFSKKQLLTKTKILITTLGEKGSLIETEKESITVGIAKAEKFVDPTGAGDAYIGGFLAAYLNDKDLKTAGERGTTAASFVIEKYGTQNHNFTSETFKKRSIQISGDVVESVK